MNGRQLATCFLLALVALSVGALVWQKSQGGRADSSVWKEEAAVEEGQIPGGSAQAGEAIPDRDAPAAETGSTPAEAATVAPARVSPAPVPATPARPAVQRTEGRDAAAAPSAPKSKPVQALYLHGTFRCETCLSIEDQTKRAITEDFATQIQAGELHFASLNMDKEAHAHYGDDFQLTSASLVLSDGRGPKGRWKVLERTWELVKDPVAFREYVGTETRAFLAAAGGN